MKKNFFIIIFFIFGLTQEAFAYSSDPKQFISEIVEEVKGILVESNTKEFKNKKNVDFIFGPVKKHWAVLYGYKPWKIHYSWGF